MGIITAVALASVCTASDGECNTTRVADFYDNNGAGLSFCNGFAANVNEVGDDPGVFSSYFCLPPDKAERLLKASK